MLSSIALSGPSWIGRARGTGDVTSTAAGQEPGQPDGLPVGDLLELDRRSGGSRRDHLVATLGTLEILVVHQLAAQVGEVRVHRAEHVVHLRLAVDPAWLEAGQHL